MNYIWPGPPHYPDGGFHKYWIDGRVLHPLVAVIAVKSWNQVLVLARPGSAANVLNT